MKKSPILNPRGDALLTAMLSIVAVAGLAYLIQSFTQVTGSRTKITRAKSVMAGVEYKIKTLVLQPDSYRNCDSNTGSSSCSFISTVLDGLRRVPVPGATCTGGTTPFCGIVMDQDSFDATTRRFTARIRYTGTDFVLNPVLIDQTIPGEVLQTRTYNCATTDSSRPIFAGFDPTTQKAICRSINSCSTGQYVKKVNTGDLQIVCDSIPTNASCSSTQFISNFTWNGGNSVSVNCANRVNPYTVSQWW